MAEIISKVLDTSVRFQQISADAFNERMLSLVMSEAVAQGGLDMGMANQAGLKNAVQRIPENLTGRTPISKHAVHRSQHLGNRRVLHPVRLHLP